MRKSASPVSAAAGAGGFTALAGAGLRTRLATTFSWGLVLTVSGADGVTLELIGASADFWAVSEVVAGVAAFSGIDDDGAVVCGAGEIDAAGRSLVCGAFGDMVGDFDVVSTGGSLWLSAVSVDGVGLRVAVAPR